MNAAIESRLKELEAEINIVLSAIHAEALEKLRTLTRSIGQRTRADRPKK